MPSLVQQALRDNLAVALKTNLGEQATYLHASGASETLTVVATAGEGQDSAYPGAHMFFRVFRGDVTPEPIPGDRVTYRAKQYKIVDVLARDLSFLLTGKL